LNGYTLAALVFVLVFGGAAFGLLMQAVLSESFTTGGSRDMAGAVVGLLTLLLALVLGLLIWTAFGVLSTQKASIQTLAVSVLKLDEALRDYGPDAADGRSLLRQTVKKSIGQMWDGERVDGAVTNYVNALSSAEDLQTYLGKLEATTDAQRTAKANAVQSTNAIGQTRLQMALALTDPISYSLIAIVLAWAVILFFGYGLLAKGTFMAYATAAVGALAIASAIYSIDDLSNPYSGLFVVSPAPIVNVLGAVDAAAAAAGGHR
jgi:hypothetical protein